MDRKALADLILWMAILGLPAILTGFAAIGMAAQAWEKGELKRSTVTLRGVLSWAGFFLVFYLAAVSVIVIAISAFGTR